VGWNASDIPDLSGRVAVVTGGNGGLGLATCRQLAAHGALVVMGARNMDKAEAACGLIRAETPTAQVESRPLDLASLASVKSFAAEVAASHPQVHMLFNNAGLMAIPEATTADGFEMQYGTNFLGHFALTMGLLPALVAAASAGSGGAGGDRSTGGARVVCTSSIARFMAGRFDLADLEMRGHYSPWTAYGISKRAMLEFAFELDRRLAPHGVRGFAADPGFSRTQLQTTSAAAMHSLQHRLWVGLLFIAEMGALPQLRAATDPGARGGHLYAPRWLSFGTPVVRKVAGRIADAAEHAALWNLAERETGVSLASSLP
jgi:NAD(P)-dependent dehydrogenase (short-subunit alcohol dehydrogenase family)